MREWLSKWTRPENYLRRLEIPMILTICVTQFGIALSIIDATVWRVATVIPFTSAAIALTAGIYVALRHADDWN
jgi:hypothetical protein